MDNIPVRMTGKSYIFPSIKEFCEEHFGEYSIENEAKATLMLIGGYLTTVSHSKGKKILAQNKASKCAQKKGVELVRKRKGSKPDLKGIEHNPKYLRNPIPVTIENMVDAVRGEKVVIKRNNITIAFLKRLKEQFKLGLLNIKIAGYEQYFVKFKIEIIDVSQCNIILNP